jgi:hypothetical protein
LSAGELIIIALRLVVPLLILRYALVGGLAALALDAADVVIIELIGLGGFGDHYAELDKLLDTYYLTLEAFVARRWDSPWARIPAIALYAWRTIGVILFETTGERWLLLVFPNQFENWWLYVVIVERFAPRLYPRSLMTVMVPMVLMLIPKLFQEWLLHYAEAQPWDWIKRNILRTT